ncbi:uncharacterized protein AMSG_00568 [Thecamonas trahens ATCC 50062]|uniref:Uncharacterized protein n=1 Tax=Thecamonas trahens ATCC 50062 TaxID=461836 RepID=A0A0L0D8X1_THETB|nr:hypothetical protein AMSG_00568 [Thecamonas trahens ATCC 50062]KNC48789.1 hypothetical protein AMSG_00568 [Thecamonas trahens ATCC 50062]|eukprot:XP_013762840.1 hypothetical protein AMSG_00568 [Thecamonas trahens ATCC 50062]
MALQPPVGASLNTAASSTAVLAAQIRSEGIRLSPDVRSQVARTRAAVSAANSRIAELEARSLWDTPPRSQPLGSVPHILAVDGSAPTFAQLKHAIAAMSLSPSPPRSRPAAASAALTSLEALTLSANMAASSAASAAIRSSRVPAARPRPRISRRPPSAPSTAPLRPFTSARRAEFSADAALASSRAAVAASSLRAPLSLADL